MQGAGQIFAAEKNDGERQIITMVSPGIGCDFCFRYATALYTEAFRRLGYGFRLVTMPSERALIESNAGSFDGEVSRMRDLNQNHRYPNLVRVDEPVGTATITAYAIADDIDLGDLEASGARGFRVAYVKGVKMVERMVRQFFDAAERIPAEDAVHAARLLVSGRADVVVSIPMLFQPILDREEFRSAPVRDIGQLGSEPFYPYLHRRHEELAPKLAATLREMKAEGTFDRILRAAKAEFNVE